jgi:hypothetical protein
VVGALLVLFGLGAAFWGVRTASARPRPASLAGAVVAAIGLALALLGALGVARPEFF